MGFNGLKAALAVAAIAGIGGETAWAQYGATPPPPLPPLPAPPPPPAPPAPATLPPVAPPAPPQLPPIAPAPLPPVVAPSPNYRIQDTERVIRQTPLTPYYVPDFPGWSIVSPGDLQRYINNRWIFNQESIQTRRRGYIALETRRAPNGKGLCLEVPGSQFKDGGLVVAGPCTGLATQYWEFDYNKLWGWQIVNNPDRRDSRGYQMCLDHYPGTATPGTQVRVWPCHPLYSVFVGTRAETGRPLKDSQRWVWHVLDGKTGGSALSPSFVQSERSTVYATCLDAGPYNDGSPAVLVRCVTPFETQGAPRWRPVTP
jgi:hypothetical protein